MGTRALMQSCEWPKLITADAADKCVVKDIKLNKAICKLHEFELNSKNPTTFMFSYFFSMQSNTQSVACLTHTFRGACNRTCMQPLRLRQPLVKGKLCPQ